MKNLATKLLVAALALNAASIAGARADDIRLGTPSYGGTGCPAGTASVSLTDDAKTLSILFDQYVVEAGRAAGKRIDRKSCNVAIPVHVPGGYSVSIIKLDYRGFNSLPEGASSTFNVEYFLAGSRGPAFSRTFRGAQDKDYLVSNVLAAEAVVWSPCGTDVILRSNSSLMTITNSRMEQTLSTLDSVDIDAGIIYQLQWRRCS